MITLRSRKKISSRVPAYQNPQIIVGYCDYLFKPQPWRGQRGLGYRLKPILMKKGLGLMEDGRGIPALKPYKNSDKSSVSAIFS